MSAFGHHQGVVPGCDLGFNDAWLLSVLYADGTGAGKLRQFIFSISPGLCLSTTSCPHHAACREEVWPPSWNQGPGTWGRALDSSDAGYSNRDNRRSHFVVSEFVVIALA